MTNKTSPTGSILNSKKERSIVSKLLWTVVLPFLAPYMFNIGGKNKEILAIILLVGTIGFNLYAQGILSSDNIAKEKYNLQETSFIQNTFKINRSISEFQAFNKEIEPWYFKMVYVTTSAVTPIPLGKLGMMILGKTQNSYDETIIVGEFNYYVKDDKSSGTCEVKIAQENFEKLDEINSYSLGFGGDEAMCEYSWGHKAHGTKTDNFGWAYAELEQSLKEKKEENK